MKALNILGLFLIILITFEKSYNYFFTNSYLSSIFESLN
jgi:hypothetical protein